MYMFTFGGLSALYLYHHKNLKKKILGINIGVVYVMEEWSIFFSSGISSQFSYINYFLM